MEILKILFPLLAALIIGGIFIPRWIYNRSISKLKPPHYNDLPEKLGDLPVSVFITILGSKVDVRIARLDSNIERATWQMMLVHLGILVGIIALALNLLA